jgi:hypothetical protein
MGILYVRHLAACRPEDDAKPRLNLE